MTDEHGPLSHSEAVAALTRLRAHGVLKLMPNARPLSRQDVRLAERVRAYRLIIQAQSEQYDRIRAADEAIEQDLAGGCGDAKDATHSQEPPVTPTHPGAAGTVELEKVK